MKNLFVLIFCLLSISAVSQNRFIMALSDDGTDYMLGLDNVRMVFENPDSSGSSVLLFNFDERLFYADDSLTTIVANSCGLFFLVSDIEDNNRPVAINVLYVEQIGELPDGTAWIKLERITERIKTQELYVDLIPIVTQCGAGGGGSPAQTLSFSSPNLTISSGNSVDISAINTDDQQVSNFSLVGTDLILELEDDGQPQHVVDFFSCFCYLSLGLAIFSF